jgi:DNA repair protein RecO (recombination protein O)
MPLYKEQGVVLRSAKLGEADKIVTVLTQGSGKVRAVAKGIRKTTSRFGGRLEPFTHVSLLVYRGRGALDTITQADIISAHRPLREDLGLFAAGETMLEAADKVAEEHERNVRLFLLLLSGLRALAGRPQEPTVVAESFLLKLLSLSGFHPSLSACAVCGMVSPELFSSGQGGAVCTGCAEIDAGPASPRALGYLAAIAAGDMAAVGNEPPREIVVRKEARALLYGFAEYHLERRMRSLPMLARGMSGSLVP